jgi:RNA polymerase sigma-70 factor (sigma-E family)
MDTRVPAPPADFEAYVAQRRLALLRAARAITGDPHTAEDLVQSALASVCSHWESLRDRRAADAYVRRAMVNQHTSWCRQPWRRRERPFGALPEPEDRWSTSPAPAPEPDRGLWPLVTALPPRQRAAVVLRYYEGLSEAEAARVLRCSLGTVKSNTSRGIATLRRRAAEAHLHLAG